jgi:hypothetical protein
VALRRSQPMRRTDNRTARTVLSTSTHSRSQWTAILDSPHYSGIVAHSCSPAPALRVCARFGISTSSGVRARVYSRQAVGGRVCRRSVSSRCCRCIKVCGCTAHCAEAGRSPQHTVIAGRSPEILLNQTLPIRHGESDFENEPTLAVHTFAMFLASPNNLQTSA